MFEFPPGATGRSITVHLRDSGTAQSKTGLAYNSAGIAIGYTRHQGTPVAVTPVDLASPNAAWASGGFKETDATIARGEYRLDLPDAALAVGAPFVTVNLHFTGVFDPPPVLILLRNPVNNVGAGSVSYTVTVQRADLTPIAGAQVWISTDANNSNIIAGSLTTNGSGQATFMLDPGSYYLFCTDEGFNGTNPTLITVS